MINYLLHTKVMQRNDLEGDILSLLRGIRVLFRTQEIICRGVETPLYGKTQFQTETSFLLQSLQKHGNARFSDFRKKDLALFSQGLFFLFIFHLFIKYRQIPFYPNNNF